MKRNDQDAPGSARPSGTVGTGPAGVMHNQAGVMHNPPRARTRVVCPPCSHTEILKESLLALPRERACARTRESTRPQADFAAWRVKTFGGDFDPVRVAVDEAVTAFSSGKSPCFVRFMSVVVVANLVLVVWRVGDGLSANLSVV